MTSTNDATIQGLVVNNRNEVMALAEKAGATVDRAFNFVDPGGNHIEIVAYRDVQFSMRDEVLRSLGLSLCKSEKAREQLHKKGIRSINRGGRTIEGHALTLLRRPRLG